MSDAFSRRRGFIGTFFQVEFVEGIMNQKLISVAEIGD